VTIISYLRDDCQEIGIGSGPAAPVENETTSAFIYNRTRGNLYVDSRSGEWEG